MIGGQPDAGEHRGSFTKVVAEAQDSVDRTRAAARLDRATLMASLAVEELIAANEAARDLPKGADGLPAHLRHSATELADARTAAALAAADMKHKIDVAFNIPGAEAEAIDQAQPE